MRLCWLISTMGVISCSSNNISANHVSNTSSSESKTNGQIQIADVRRSLKPEVEAMNECGSKILQ